MRAIRSDLEKEINKVYQERKLAFPPTYQDEIARAEACLSEKAIIYLRFLLAYLPDQDVCAYPVRLFVRYVAHSLEMRRLAPWGERFGDEIFLNYVLHYRVNNEDIVFCRDRFAAELSPKIQCLSMTEAALEVNRWCYEKVAYQSSDVRTLSPWGMLKRGFGRCGEESVFCVTAMRSVGIPARQVYAPKWSHCDDNHAWVEVFIDEEWRFMGACEPEPCLDRGWFIEAASRAMMIHTRIFSTIGADESSSVSTTSSCELNLLSHYAKTRKVKILVVDESKQPVCGASLRIQVVNYAQLATILRITSDERGSAELVTGIGDFALSCAHKGLVGFRVVGANEDKIVFELTAPNCAPFFFSLNAPKPERTKQAEVESDSAKRHQEKLSRYQAARNANLQTWLCPDQATVWAKRFSTNQGEICDFLIEAKGNYRQIMRFLAFEQVAPKLTIQVKISLLRQLAKKDLADITCDLLLDFAYCALERKGDYPEEIFTSSVLNPRVEWEPLTRRSELYAFFSPEQREGFSTNPETIVDYLGRAVLESEETEYSLFYGSPLGALQYGRCNAATRRVLFVAICRCLGVPAYVRKADKNMFYYSEGEWRIVEERKPRHGYLLLMSEQVVKTFTYARDYTISSGLGGEAQTLDLADLDEWRGESRKIALPEGDYRILTTTRCPNGDVQCSVFFAHIRAEEICHVQVNLPKISMKSLHISMDKFPVRIKRTGIEETKSIVSLCNRECNLLACLEIGEEPTEHLLAEIIEAKKQFLASHVSVTFLISSAHRGQSASLSRAIASIQYCKAIHVENWAELRKAFQSLEGFGENCPHVALCNKRGEVYQIWSGYQVNMAGLILDVINDQIS